MINVYKAYTEELERQEAARKAGQPIPPDPLATALIAEMRALDAEVQAVESTLAALTPQESS